MPAIGNSILILLGVLTNPTPAERLTPDFYGAVGAQVQAEWRIEPSSIPVTGEALLTLTIFGADPTFPLTPPDLTTLPDWQALASRVQVMHQSIGADSFTYTLRPKVAGPLEVPALTVRYLRPGLPAGERFRTTYADPVLLTVTPTEPVKPVEEAHRVTLDLPPRAGITWPRWSWLLTLPLGWLAAWRASHRNQPNRLPTRMMKRLRHALESDAPAETIDQILRRNLTTSGVRATNLTAAEIVAQLRIKNWPDANVAAIGNLLALCEQSRYSAHNVPGPELRVQLRELIDQWVPS